MDTQPSMYSEKLSDDARLLFPDARALAKTMGHGRVEPEHLLKVLLDRPATSAHRILKGLRGSLEALTQAASAAVESLPAGTQAMAGEIPLSADTEKVIEIAVSDAHSFGEDLAGLDFLLGAIAGHSVGEASRVLKSVHVGRKHVLKAIPVVRHTDALESRALADPDVRQIGSRRQLFIDDYLIAATTNLKRRFHSATKHNGPVIEPEHPWEGVGVQDWPSVLLFGDVSWDEDLQQYRMWYTTATGMEEGQHRTLYATSPDGVAWHKPLDLNIVKYAGSGSNNILLDRVAPQNVIHRPDEPDPNRRYQLFAFDRNVNACAWRFSADGLRWSDPHVVESLRGFGDIGNVAWDDTRQLYVLAVKKGHDSTYADPVLGKYPGLEHRVWYHTTSPDTKDWSPTTIMRGEFDEIDLALYMEGERCIMLNTYGLSMFAYHGLYIGLQWVFGITDACGFSNCHGGPMDGRLIVSRDWNQPWNIPSRTFQLPRGEKGQWDWGMICGIANRPVVSPSGDEWYYYYGGWDYSHGVVYRRACIGLAKLRVDGFASVESADTEGQLLTPILSFEGSQLKLNVNAIGEDAGSGRNYARVALLDAAGKEIDGFDMDRCDPIRTNAINHVVTWNGRSDVSDLAGRQIRLRILLKGAELYALQFDD